MGETDAQPGDEAETVTLRTCLMDIINGKTAAYYIIGANGENGFLFLDDGDNLEEVLEEMLEDPEAVYVGLGPELAESLLGSLTEEELAGSGTVETRAQQ